MYARPFIDSLDFAASGAQMDTQVDFAELPRLLEELVEPQGKLRFQLQGGLDNQGRPVLDLSVTASLQLCCQRCLKAMDYTVQHDSRLLLCDQASLDVLEDQEEDFDGILADDHLDVFGLVEDEVLLCLPISPMHDAGDCQRIDNGEKQQDVRNPFAVLEKLKHH